MRQYSVVEGKASILNFYQFVQFKDQQPLMINFASLFNTYRQQNSSGLTELLQKPNVCIGRLLDEESFLSEYKASNPRVTQFMTYPRYAELLQFLTVVGSPDDKKRGYKYPLSACDLLSSDNTTALEYFLPNKPIKIEETVEEEVQVEVEHNIDESVSEEEKDCASSLEKQNTREQEAAPTGQDKDVKQEAATEEKAQPKEEKEENEEVKSKEGSTVDEKEQSKEPVKTETRTQIKKISKTVQKQVPALMQELLKYFKGEINYTLAGYVSRVLTHLFNKRPAELLDYILLEESMQEAILDHAESRSVGDFLVKVLANESSLQLERRGQMFRSMLKRLSTTSQVPKMSNLSAYVCEIIEKIAANTKSNNPIPHFATTFLPLQEVTSIINNVMSNQEDVSAYNSPILLTYLTTIPLVLPKQEAPLQAFSQLLTSFIQKSCNQKLQVKRDSHARLGVGRMRIVETLSHLLKENVLETRDIVARQQNFFPTLYTLLTEYDRNNMLHNEVMRMVCIAIEQKEDSPINKAILQGDSLLNLISKETGQDQKIRRGQSVYKSRKGYIAHLINLCVKLRQLAKNNSAIKNLVEKPQFKAVLDGLIEKELFNTGKSLAGYAVKKVVRHEIHFQKDDILASYTSFFQNCPPAVFEQEPDPTTFDMINIQHPDLLMELQRQLQENLSVPSKEKQQQKTPQQVVLPEQQAQVIYPSQYWTTHLDYSVDDLLADL